MSVRRCEWSVIVHDRWRALLRPIRWNVSRAVSVPNWSKKFSDRGPLLFLAQTNKRWWAIRESPPRKNLCSLRFCVFPIEWVCNLFLVHKMTGTLTVHVWMLIDSSTTFCVTWSELFFLGKKSILNHELIEVRRFEPQFCNPCRLHLKQSDSSLNWTL
jgi:hypothetical protein